MRRGRTEVLHDIDLDVHAGEFVAVVGANGAGKTTLIQAIAGVIPPPRGTVHIDGIDVGRSDARTLSTRVGFVFQNPEHQFIAHTVFDELAHGLRLRHLSEDEVRTRTEEVLERFGLADKARSAPVPAVGRAEAAAVRRHGARRGRPRARPRRADLRPGPRPRRRTAEAAAGAQPRRHDGPRGHPRHAAGHRVRRSHDRPRRRPRAGRRPDRRMCSPMRRSSRAPVCDCRRCAADCWG